MSPRPEQSAPERTPDEQEAALDAVACVLETALLSYQPEAARAVYDTIRHLDPIPTDWAFPTAREREAHEEAIRLAAPALEPWTADSRRAAAAALRGLREFREDTARALGRTTLRHGA